MTATDRDLQALTYLARRLRDETYGAGRWDEVGIMAALRKVQHLSLDELLQRVVSTATDPEARTPAALVVRKVFTPVPPHTLGEPHAADQCGTCGKHRSLCQCRLDSRARPYNEGARDDTTQPASTARGIDGFRAARKALRAQPGQVGETTDSDNEGDA